jgi:AcrR family transcriptional regulator
MSTSTRRERERAAVRSRLVTVALQILENEGAGAITVRRVATEVEYTAPVIYQHFVNKEALLLTLVEIGHEQLRQRMAESWTDVPGDDAQLVKAAQAYVAFATDNPHLYQMMTDSTIDAEQRFQAAAPSTSHVIGLLTTWAATQNITVRDPMEMCELAWGTIHGIAGIGQLGTIGSAKAIALAEKAMHALILWWRTHPDDA